MNANKVINWIRSSLMGVGCSLLATAFVAMVTPGSEPFILAFSLVSGLVMMLADLVISLAVSTDEPKEK